MLKNLNISQRMNAAFFTISVLVAVSGAIGVGVITLVGRMADVMFEVEFPTVREARMLAISLNAELVALYSLALGEQDAAALADARIKETSSHISTLIKSVSDPDITTTIRNLKVGHDRLSPLLMDLKVRLGEAADRSQALEMVKSQEQNVATMLLDVDSIIEDSEKEMGDAMDRMDSFQKYSRTALVVITVLAFLLSFLLGRKVSAGITKPLNALIAHTKEISAGDLTGKISGTEERDEIGVLAGAFGGMVESLREQIREVVDGTSVIAASVSELSASSAQLAAAAAENATSISETTTTVEEVRQTTELTSTKAEQIATDTTEILETSRQGRVATDETVKGMEKIQAQMTAIGETIIRLSEQSQAIGQIIATVDSLSEQSNVLAVNASIEAAKAGEHGRGFSVVAQEVKSLADQSKQATKQVREILNEIQRATSSAVMATEQGGKVVEKGTERATQAGRSIVMLAERIDRSSAAVSQIAAASHQQRIGMDQIAAAMATVREASRQNAASAKQLEGAVDSLKTLGGKLKKVAARYQM